MRLRPGRDPGGAVQVLPEPACPECGREVVYSLTCHTYGQDGKFYACMPCDSAVDYVCAGQFDDKPTGCEWEYTHGLNPRNPRAARNEERRPSWIPAGQDYAGKWFAHGVKAIWE